MSGGWSDVSWDDKRLGPWVSDLPVAWPQLVPLVVVMVLAENFPNLCLCHGCSTDLAKASHTSKPTLMGWRKTPHLDGRRRKIILKRGEHNLLQQADLLLSLNVLKCNHYIPHSSNLCLI